MEILVNDVFFKINSRGTPEGKCGKNIVNLKL